MVTVVIPTHNSELYVQRAVDSVCADDLTSVEILVVDDGSSDGTRELIRKLEKQVPHLNSILVEHGGANRARNIGLDHARGRYVQFLDADDVLANNKLCASSGVMERNENVVGVYTDWGNDRDVSQTSGAAHENIEAIVRGEFDEFTFGLNTNAPLWRRSFIENRSLRWDESLICWQESEFYFRILIELRDPDHLVHLPIKGFFRSVRGGGVSSTYNSPRYIEGQERALRTIRTTGTTRGLWSDALEEQYQNFLKDLMVRALIHRHPLLYERYTRITRSQETGFRRWDRADFISRFRYPWANRFYQLLRVGRNILLKLHLYPY